MIVSKPNQDKQGTNNIPEKRYVPLKTTQDIIIPSKVMVIENLRVIINDDLNEMNEELAYKKSTVQKLMKDKSEDSDK